MPMNTSGSRSSRRRFNWRRSRAKPAEYLDKAMATRPRSIRGLLARASAAIDDGELRGARRALGVLGQLAPGRRDVRTQQPDTTRNNGKAFHVCFY